MTSKPKNPSADAHIDELQAWAARANKAATGDAGAPAGTGSARTTPPPPASAAASFGLPAMSRSREATGSGRRGGSLLPKVLIALGIGVAAYLVFSFIVGLLMTLLMIVGGVALIYAVYRVGRWRGRRDD